MGELSPDDLQNVVHWPFLPALTRLALAVAIGVFVGLEREHSGKAGVRTFALTSLLGSATGMSGGFYPAASLAFTALIVVLLNAGHLMTRTKWPQQLRWRYPGGILWRPLRRRSYLYASRNGAHHSGSARVETTDLGFCRWLTVRKSDRRFYWEF